MLLTAHMSPKNLNKYYAFDIPLELGRDPLGMHCPFCRGQLIINHFNEFFSLLSLEKV